MASMVAPAGTTSAWVAMDVTSLSETIYVDDFAFMVTPSPTITSFTPTSGPGGTVVTIAGSNFTGATTVAFNGQAAAAFGVNSDTQIQALVPSGASSGPISITTPAGTGSSTSNFTVTAPPPGNLLLNPGFELDVDNNSSPDGWTTSARFLRSNEVVHSGSFAGKHLEAGAGRTIAQTIPNLTAGRTYSVSGWVNIPLTTTIYQYKLRVTWLDASGTVISSSTFKTYTAPTVGWDNAVANLVAPAGTTQAQIQLITNQITGA